jgi:sec-independent protein translocase protein TatA
MFRNPYGDALVVLLIVLLILGPKRLPMLGKSLGQGIREFKDSIGGGSDESDDDERPELESSTATSQPAEREPAASAAASADERSES